MTSVFEGQPFKNKAFATPAGSSTGFQVREQYLRNTLVWKTLACHFDVKSQTWQNIDLQNIPETEKKAFFCHCKHKGNSRRTPKPTFRWHWLLMVVQKSQTANRRLDASNLVHNRIDYQPQLVDAGFLNHQRYVCYVSSKVSGRVTFSSDQWTIRLISTHKNYLNKKVAPVHRAE